MIRRDRGGDHFTSRDLEHLLGRGTFAPRPSPSLPPSWGAPTGIGAAGGADFLAPIELAGDVMAVKVQYAGAATSNSRLIWNLGI